MGDSGLMVDGNLTSYQWAQCQQLMKVLPKDWEWRHSRGAQDLFLVPLDKSAMGDHAMGYAVELKGSTYVRGATSRTFTYDRNQIRQRTDAQLYIQTWFAKREYTEEQLQTELFGEWYITTDAPTKTQRRTPTSEALLEVQQVREAISSSLAKCSLIEIVQDGSGLWIQRAHARSVGEREKALVEREKALVEREKALVEREKALEEMVPEFIEKRLCRFNRATAKKAMCNRNTVYDELAAFACVSREEARAALIGFPGISIKFPHSNSYYNTRFKGKQQDALRFYDCVVDLIEKGASVPSELRLTAFQLGQCCKLIGLQSETGLNGTMVKLLGFSEPRWLVRNLNSSQIYNVMPSNLQVVAKTESPVESLVVFDDADPGYVPTIQVLADNRCLFRAVLRGLDMEADSLIERNIGGEAVLHDRAVQETDAADKLRQQTCDLMLRNRTDLLKLLADNSDPDEYVRRMRDPRTWAGEVELYFLPAVLQRPITAWCLNLNTLEIFSATYISEWCATWREIAKSKVVAVWYNGCSHYDLVKEDWYTPQSQNIHGHRMLKRQVSQSVLDDALLPPNASLGKEAAGTDVGSGSQSVLDDTVASPATCICKWFYGWVPVDAPPLRMGGFDPKHVVATGSDAPDGCKLVFVGCMCGARDANAAGNMTAASSGGQKRTRAPGDPTAGVYHWTGRKVRREERLSGVEGYDLPPFRRHGR
mmetsp:Transcript_18657/g.32404  ORF Transcript_18657/g.32404 Transcript_18657/m.32404 type:complete len:708 (+) Transcript_18657:56-2179(+)